MNLWERIKFIETGIWWRGVILWMKLPGLCVEEQLYVSPYALLSRYYINIANPDFSSRADVHQCNFQIVLLIRRLVRIARTNQPIRPTIKSSCKGERTNFAIVKKFDIWATPISSRG
jgi:hypothetical protein